MKPQSNLDSLARYPVAPPVGAWIETEFGGRLSMQLSVAPPVGAWIETGRQCDISP